MGRESRGDAGWRGSRKRAGHRGTRAGFIPTRVGGTLVRMRLRPAQAARIAMLTIGIVWPGLQADWAQSAAEAAEKMRRANALVQADKPEQAIPIYRELVAAFPKMPSLRVNLAVAQYKAGRY